MRKQRAATNVRLECIQAKLQKRMQTNTERNSASSLEKRALGFAPAPLFIVFQKRVTPNNAAERSCDLDSIGRPEIRARRCHER